MDARAGVREGRFACPPPRRLTAAALLLAWGTACGGQLAPGGDQRPDSPTTGDSGNPAAPPSDGGTGADARAAAEDAGLDASIADVGDGAVADASGELPDGLPTVVCDAGQPVPECVEYYALLWPASTGTSCMKPASRRSSPRARPACSKSSRSAPSISSGFSKPASEAGGIFKSGHYRALEGSIARVGRFDRGARRDRSRCL